MANEIRATSETEVREIVQEYLEGKGVDAETAKYLADLASKSDRGRAMASGKPIQPAGSCSIPGLFPG